MNSEPLIFRIEKNGWVVILKFGVVLFWDVPEKHRHSWIGRIQKYLVEEFGHSVFDEVEIYRSLKEDRVREGDIYVKKLSSEKVALISIILGRSLALEHYEKEADVVLNSFEPLVRKFMEKGSLPWRNRPLLKKIGFAMNVQHQIVSQMAFLDKPDLAWHDTDLDKFYNKLAMEYELDDRYEVLNEKLKLIVQDIEFMIDLLDTKRGLLLEWIIVFLILLEVVLFIAWV